MTTRLTGFAAVAVLALAACGDDGGAQDEVADMMIEAMADEGLDVDEGCLRDATAQLSDEDAQKIVDAGPDGDPEGLSAEADAVANQAVGCVDIGSLVDEMVDQLVADMGEENVDVDCIRDAADGLDLTALEDSEGEFMSDLFGCVDLGG